MLFYIQNVIGVTTSLIERNDQSLSHAIENGLTTKKPWHRGYQ